MSSNDVLLVWTICENPSDYPDKFTARPTAIDSSRFPRSSSPIRSKRSATKCPPWGWSVWRVIRRMIRSSSRSGSKTL